MSSRESNEAVVSFLKSSNKNKKMVEKKFKEGNGNVFLLSVIILISVIGFVFAAGYDIMSGTDKTASFNFTEDVYSLTNLSINNTNVGGNVTQVNITFPTGTTFNYSSNRTGANATFVASSLTLSWTNTSEFLINSSNQSMAFWINASFSTPGWYNLTIVLVNGTAGTAADFTTKNFTLIINDTTRPIVYPANFSLTSFGNYSGIQTLGVNVSDAGSFGIGAVYFNVTNSLGGNSSNLSTIYKTVNTTFWSYVNTTFNSRNFAESRLYNITAFVNDTNANVNITTITNITFDNTPPLSSTTNYSNTTVRYGNYSGLNKIINISVSDALTGVQTVYFNITNITQKQNATYTAIRESTSNSYSIAFNTTAFPDGIYNITAFTLDYAGNVNATPMLSNITIDNTAPSISITTSSVDSTSFVFTYLCTDALSGVVNCDVSTTGGTISGSNKVTGLICGNSYNLTVTSTDYAGNVATSSSSVTATACSSGGSSGGGGGGGIYTGAKTYADDDKELSQKGTVSRQLAVNDRVKLKINTETHYVSVKSVSQTQVGVEVSSTPQTATLLIGQEKKFDINNDGYYDLNVKLNAVVNGKADLSVSSIHEAVPVVQPPVQEEKGVGEQLADAGGNLVDNAGQVVEGKASYWVYVLLTAIIILVIVYLLIRISKKKRYKKYGY